MNKNHSDLRNFRSGAWDLRRIERRKDQMTIEFPDRRRNDRRNTGGDHEFSPAGNLLWVDQNDRDE